MKLLYKIPQTTLTGTPMRLVSESHETKTFTLTILCGHEKMRALVFEIYSTRREQNIWNSSHMRQCFALREAGPLFAALTPLEPPTLASAAHLARSSLAARNTLVLVPTYIGKHRSVPHITVGTLWPLSQ